MNGQLRNCARCHSLFVPINEKSSTRFCIECLKKEDDSFKLVRNYLFEFPSSGVEEVSAATGVDDALIIQFLKEGRIEITSGNCVLNCEKCFEPIRSGRYCSSCTAQLSKNLTSIVNLKNDENAVASMLTKIRLRDR